MRNPLHLVKGDLGGGVDLVGLEARLLRNSDSAIEKHAACAAPISSSGLVPFWPSNREARP